MLDGIRDTSHAVYGRILDVSRYTFTLSLDGVGANNANLTRMNHSASLYSI